MALIKFQPASVLGGIAVSAGIMLFLSANAAHLRRFPCRPIPRDPRSPARLIA